MEPYLPQEDPNPTARKQLLEQRREEYFFNYTYIPGYPFLDHVPKREGFSGYYWIHRFSSVTLLPFNIAAAKLRTALIQPIRRLHDLLNSTCAPCTASPPTSASTPNIHVAGWSFRDQGSRR